MFGLDRTTRKSANSFAIAVRLLRQNIRELLANIRIGSTATTQKPTEKVHKTAAKTVISQAKRASLGVIQQQRCK